MVIVSESKAPGAKTPLRISFDQPIRLGSRPPFLFFTNSSHAIGAKVSNGIDCNSEFPTAEFKEIFSGFLTIVGTNNLGNRIVMESASVPLNVAYNYRTSIPRNTSTVLRLVFFEKLALESCADWWLGIFSTFAHELTHLNFRLGRRTAPNLLTEEVVATSVARCVTLIVRPPSKIRMTEFEAIADHPDNDDFEATYSQLLSHLMENPELKNPSMQGKILADLHFYKMLDRSYPSALTDRQRRIINYYCTNIARVPLDFTKQSFFKADSRS